MVDIPREGTHWLVVTLEMRAWRKHPAGTRVRHVSRLRHRVKAVTQSDSLLALRSLCTSLASPSHSPGKKEDEVKLQKILVL